MKSQGHNTVENLVKVLKDSKIIEKANETEKSVTEMFRGEDQLNVSLAKFKEVLTDMASRAKVSVDQVMEVMQKDGGTIFETLRHAAGAISSIVMGAGTSKDAKK
ncbi:hypothetical protein NE865_10235 [Phthorimaea operculella]|nr:hypothetical protein NE865_10235 [Phthorimaea operculella]